jgi:hypothetical protein
MRVGSTEMRWVVLALAFLAALPATASAAPFAELPFLSLAGAAECVQAPGPPGLLARGQPRGIRFLQAGPAGWAQGEAASLSRGSFPCPVVAVAASGAGVVAGRTLGSDKRPFHVTATARDPGGAWAKPQTLARRSAPPPSLVAAVSERGDAALAWTETKEFLTGPYRLRLARRAPGGAFGPPVTVLTTAAADDPSPGVRMGFSAAGELIMAWVRRDRSGIGLEVAIAPAGGPLGAPQRIGPIRAGAAPGLAVAPDGSALLSYATGNEVRVAERPPGGAFGAPVKVAAAEDVFAVETHAALAPGGAAAVAWQSVFQGGVGMVTRAGPGAFRPAVALARSHTIPPATAKIVAEILKGLGDLGDFGAVGFGGGLQVALAGDSAVATWTRQRRVDGLRTRELRVGALPLAGGRLELQTLGGTLRDVRSAAPVALPDGRAAVAWTDEGEKDAHGRVHLAVAGAAAAAPLPAPVVRFGRPRERVLDRQDPLRVPVTCSAACDVRIQRAGRTETEALLTLPAAGTRTVTIDALLGPIAPLRRGPVRFRVATGPPGGPATVRVVAFTLRRRPPPPVPHVIGLTAVRRGGSIAVRWRTDRRSNASAWVVAGERRRTDVDDPLAVTGGRGGGRRFHATLRPARGVRWVVVLLLDDDRAKPTFVRVR